MDYIHIYELEGDWIDGTYTPKRLNHTKAVITKKTRNAYYYMVEGVEERVLKGKIGKVLTPNFTRLYLITPDNEQARKIFTERFDCLIEDCNYKMAVYRNVKRVVARFKD